MTDAPASDEHRLPHRSRIIQQELTEAGYDIRVHELPDSTRTALDAAAALDCPVGAIASSLLFLADGEPLLVMASGRHRVDTDLLATELGATSIALADARTVRSVTGQAIGGVAPIGHPTPLPTVVDETLREYGTIWSAAGTPHTVMPLTFEQLVALTGGRVFQVSTS